MHVSFLRPLFDSPGPWATVYLDDSLDTEMANEKVKRRWRAMREQLAEQGTDDATLDAMEAVVDSSPHRPGQHGLAVFATRGEVRRVEELPGPPPVDSATLAPLPHVIPLLAQLGDQIAWVRVTVDRTGADIEHAAIGAGPRTTHIEGGEDFPIRKVAAGGWSQSRIQRGAELTWRRNTGDVAVAVTELADLVGAEVVVIAGDVRARQLLIDQLPERWRERVIQTDAGSRAAGSDPEPLDDVTVQAITETAVEHTEAALDRFAEQRGNDVAATGVKAVVAALDKRQVDTLLLDPEQLDTEKLWIGADPAVVAVDDGQLRAMGEQRPQPAPAADALIMAAAATDADVVLVTHDQLDLAEGAAAVLRYPDR